MKHNGQIRVVVVGNGMVSQRFVERLCQLDPGRTFHVTVFGEEPHPAYDRVHLTSLFGGKSVEELVIASRAWYEERGIALVTSVAITELELESRVVIDEHGNRTPWDRLVLATGSSAFIPTLPGLDPGPRVLVYRTVNDVERIKAAATEAGRAAVIGGGLLGLEAAKALVDLGIEAHVLEYGTHLMGRQLDLAAGKLLAHQVTDLGVHVHTNARTREVLASPLGLRIELDGVSPLDVDFVVVATGIRPRDELARSAGIEVAPRGGILVDERLATRAPDVYAIGECAAKDGIVLGLIAPGLKMAEVLAKNFVGEATEYAGSDGSTKLKLLGVDVASFGDPFADKATGRAVVLEDFASGIYKKLCLSSDGSRLLGGMLVGDAQQYAELLELCRSGKALDERPETWLLPPRSDAKKAPFVPSQVCSCNGISRQCIVDAIAAGANSLGEIKTCTGAGTGCGGCLPVVADVLKMELLRLGRAIKPRLCEHFAFGRQELFDLVRVKGYRTFQEVLLAHGRGLGCEVCRPTLASILASVHNEPILDHDTLQDTNDRYLANIQKGGTYSVVPRIAGGEITPDQLLVIAQVAKRYGLYTKITGGQRIDLFGARVEQLPSIWEELVAAGFESGHAYGKALRTVKSCVGSTWCRFGVQDSVGMAIRVENRYKGIRAPHKIKGGVSGCTRECAEAQGKDFGLIATERGYNLYVCGNGGANPRHADLLATDLDPETAIRYLDRFLCFYIRTADRLTRTSKWLEALDGGIDYLRSVIIDDSLGIAAELEAHMEQLVATYRCEWADVVNSPEKRRKFEELAVRPKGLDVATLESNAVGDSETESGARHMERGQWHPDVWASPPKLRRLPLLDLVWVELGDESQFPKDGGRTIVFGRAKLAVFHLEATAEWFVTQAHCPHRGDAVLGRGLIGDVQGEPKVACPQHKKTFSLRSGKNLEGETDDLQTFRVKLENGRIFAELPRNLWDQGFSSSCEGSCEQPCAAE